MISKAEERKSDLRNTTVMEVILAVIIVLLCFIHMKDQDLFKTKNSLSVLTEKINEQEIEIKKLTQENTDLKKDKRKLEDAIESLKAQNERLKKMISKFGGSGGFDALQKAYDELEDKYQKLQLKVAELKRENEELKEENKLLRAQNLNLMLKTGSIDTEKQDLIDEIVQLKTEITELKRQLEALKKIAQPNGIGGIDKPRCKVDDRKLSVIAHLDKVGNRYSFNLKGDDKQKNELMQIPGINELSTSVSFTLSQFKTHARRVNGFALKQDPQCVFYISFDPDQMRGSEIKVFERYFYKVHRSN